MKLSKRITAFAIVFAILAGLLPEMTFEAKAAETVITPISGQSYTAQNGKSYTLSAGSFSNWSFVVPYGISTTLTVPDTTTIDNTVAGTSPISIQGSLELIVNGNLTVIGQQAHDGGAGGAMPGAGGNGGWAGIYVSELAYLYVRGAGSLNAFGGSAGRGGNGADSGGTFGEDIYRRDGCSGGGGGGAGAGIGGNGGGGAGAPGGGESYEQGEGGLGGSGGQEAGNGGKGAAGGEMYGNPGTLNGGAPGGTYYSTGSSGSGGGGGGSCGFIFIDIENIRAHGGNGGDGGDGGLSANYGADGGGGGGGGYPAAGIGGGGGGAGSAGASTGGYTGGGGGGGYSGGAGAAPTKLYGGSNGKTGDSDSTYLENSGGIAKGGDGYFATSNGGGEGGTAVDPVKNAPHAGEGGNGGAGGAGGTIVVFSQNVQAIDGAGKSDNTVQIKGRQKSGYGSGAGYSVSGNSAYANGASNGSVTFGQKFDISSNSLSITGNTETYYVTRKMGFWG